MSASKEVPKAQNFQTSTSVPLSSTTQGTTIRSQIEEVAEEFNAANLPQDVMSWRKEDVSKWIKLKFSDHLELEKIFLDNEIDSQPLLGLTNEKLRDDLGVKQLGVRERILKEIAKLKKPGSLTDTEILTELEKLLLRFGTVTKNTPIGLKKYLKKPGRAFTLCKKYYPRGDEDIFVDVANNNGEFFDQDLNDPKRIQILEISGCSGIGKSCSSCSIGSTLRQTNNTRLQKALEIYIDFSNGDALRDFENSKDDIIGLRLFCKGLLLKPVYKCGMGDPELQELCEKGVFRQG